jgi:hypothetical protein
LLHSINSSNTSHLLNLTCEISWTGGEWIVTVPGTRLKTTITRKRRSRKAWLVGEFSSNKGRLLILGSSVSQLQKLGCLYAVWKHLVQSS